MLQLRGQTQRDAPRSSEEVAKRGVERMLALDPPQAKPAEPATAQDPPGLEALQRPLRGVRIRFRPPDDLVRVQLLPGCRCQERQDPGGGFTPDKGMRGSTHFH